MTDADTDDAPMREYADVKLSCGAVVIYDTTRAEAWIQSDYAIPMGQ